MIEAASNHDNRAGQVGRAEEAEAGLRSQKFARQSRGWRFWGSGRWIWTTQKRWPACASITTERSSVRATLAPSLSSRETSAGMSSVSNFLVFGAARGGLLACC